MAITAPREGLPADLGMSEAETGSPGREASPSADLRRTWFAVFGLLVVISTIWSLALPLGSSPDENEHIVRAATVVRGQIVGTDAPGKAPLDVIVTAPGTYAASVRAPLCYAFDQRIPAGCQPAFPTSERPTHVSIYVGRYPPIYYAVVGLPTLVFSNPIGFYFARLVSAILCDAFMALALALALVRLRSIFLTAGLVVAITPMVLYLSAVVNPSSLEIAAAVAFWTLLTTIALRYPANPPRYLVVWTAISGAALSSARSISPIWTLAAVAALAPLWWKRVDIRSLVQRWDVRTASAAIFVAAVGETAWTILYHGTRVLNAPLPASTSVTGILHGAIGQAGGYLDQAIGVFGLAVPAPELVFVTWTAALGGLGFVAWSMVRKAADRVAMVSVLGVALCLPTVIVALAAKSHGYIGYGRYFLPLYVGVPITTGAVVLVRPTLTSLRFIRALIGVIAFAQVLAFYQCLHRYTVGTGGPVSPLSSVPGGWAPPVPAVVLDAGFAVAMIAAALLLVGRLNAMAPSSARVEPVLRPWLMARVTSRPERPDRSTDRRWPELDGIRAFAVAWVSLFHVFVVWAPTWNPLRPSGGFLGVDVFFVLSGYLITTLLLGERDGNRSISIRAFYGRRALRLFPALAVLLVLVAAAAVLARGNDWSRPTLLALPWVVLYAGNWNGAFYGGAHPLGALGHTWSLSVEEQFYLLWPVLLILVVRRFSNRRLIALGLLGLMIAEDLYKYLALNPHVLGWGIQRVYYGTDTHSDGLLLGCAAAFWLSSRKQKALSAKSARLLDVATVGAVLALVALVQRSTFTRASGLWFDTPMACLCTAVILTNMVTRPLPLLGSLLRSRPLVWLGRRSYGIYLWVTADFIILNGHGRERLGEYPYNFVLLAGSVLVAALSYRVIELPFLRRKRRLQTAPPPVHVAPEPELA